MANIVTERLEKTSGSDQTFRECLSGLVSKVEKERTLDFKRRRMSKLSMNSSLRSEDGFS